MTRNVIYWLEAVPYSPKERHSSSHRMVVKTEQDMKHSALLSKCHPQPIQATVKDRTFIWRKIYVT
jgi:hypothetical protein